MTGAEGKITEQAETPMEARDLRLRPQSARLARLLQAGPSQADGLRGTEENENRWYSWSRVDRTELGAGHWPERAQVEKPRGPLEREG